MGIFAWGGSRTLGIPGVTQADSAGGVVVIIAVSLAVRLLLYSLYLIIRRIRAATDRLLFVLKMIVEI